MADPNLNIKIAATDETQQAFQSVRRSMLQTGETASRMGAQVQQTQGGFRGVGNVAQQAGYQLQDFATQVSGGTSALLAFGQQAPQFLGIFGAGGVVAGAAIAVSVLAARMLGFGESSKEAAKATSFFNDVVEAVLPNLKAAGNEVDTVAGRYTALAKSIGAAAEIAARADIGSRMQVLAEQRAALNKELEQFGNIPFMGPESQPERRLLRRLGIKETADEIRKAGEALQALQAFKMSGDVPALVQQFDRLGGAYRVIAERQAGAMVRYMQEEEAIRLLNAQLRELQGTATEADKALLRTVMGDKSIETRRDDIDAFLERIRATINALDPVRAATEKYEEQASRLRYALEEGMISQQEYIFLINRASDALDEARKAQTQTVETSREYNRALDEQAQRLREQIDPTVALARELEKIDELYRTGRLSADEWAKASTAARDKLNEKTKQTDDLARDLGFTFQSAFEDAIVKGGKLRDVIAGIGQDIARLILRQTVTRPLAGFASEAIGGAGTWLSGLLGGGGMMSAPNAPWLGLPGFADGGAVGGGRPIIVGEHGPEIFVPPSSGQIIPNGQSMGGTVVNQTINISVGVAQTVRAELAALMPAIKKQTVDAVADARMRGGSFASAMGT